MTALKRKHISTSTKLAATLLARGEIPYEHAKLMGKANLLSLYHFDHNIYVESQDPDRDEFWNLAPLLIYEHREKTKRDMRIIAKGRRIRRLITRKMLAQELFPGFAAVEGRYRKRKLRSRGFDKTLTRKMRTGEVVKRKERRKWE